MDEDHHVTDYKADMECLVDHLHLKQYYILEPAAVLALQLGVCLILYLDSSVA